MRRTRAVLELFALGMDSTLAETLQAAEWTIPKLRKQSDWDLMQLGISAEIRQSLQLCDPPAIPVDTLSELLEANRAMCCICRLPNQIIVAHTIVPVDAGGSHSAQNIAILCQYHHIEALSEAQRTRSVGIPPTIDRLVSAKKTWEHYYEEPDLVSVKQRASRPGEVNWWYFNLLELCEIVKAKAQLNQLPSFHSVFKNGLCNEEGIPVQAPNAPSLYQGTGGLALYAYMFEVLFELLGTQSLRSIYSTDRQSSVVGTVKKGNLICFQGEHIFEEFPSVNTDRHLIRSTSRFRRMEVSFVFDLDESTSKLAKTMWLCGQKEMASIILVTQAGYVGTTYCIVGNVLAIRSASDRVKG